MELVVDKTEFDPKDNPFALKADDYKRDLNIIQHAVYDGALFLNKMTGKPFAQCEAYIKKQMQPGGRFEFCDPKAYYLHRGENGDREKCVIPFSHYLRDAVQNQELIAPTLTTYLPVHVKQALLVDYIDENVAMRAAAKKQEFIAMQSKNALRRTLKKIEQNNRKIRNNAVSGSHVTPSNPLYNPTGHSTLTSICRNTSGYGNANNEKILSGNRHYWSPTIALNNLISIVGHSDYAVIKAAIDQYGLRCPTIDETVSCVKYSTDLYWRTKRDFIPIYKFICKLTDLERAAVVYTGDLFHLMLCNEQVVKTMITKLSSARVGVPHPDADTVMGTALGDHIELACQLCPDETTGKLLSDMKGTPEYGIVASTVVNLQRVLFEYRNLIRAFWVTVNVPASMANLPNSVRRVVLVSDTDSTIFTVQDWVIWHCGRLAFDQKGMGVAAVLIFIACQTVTHILARMSANLGIEKKRLFQIAMKNEYKYDVFVPTQVAKHYFASKSAQEGNIYDKPEMEIKGVHLKNSNVSKRVINEAAAMMKDITDAVIAEEKINLTSKLRQVAAIEHRIISTIRRGENDYFKSTQIKHPDSYTKPPDESPYKHYTFWQEVFAPKYGFTEAPPFAVVKISVDLSSTSKMKTWIANMKDRELAARLERWRTKDGKSRVITTFQLPQALIRSNGIPDEIFEMIDYRRIVLDTTNVFYIILEAIGFYMLDKKITKLISDQIAANDCQYLSVGEGAKAA